MDFVQELRWRNMLHDMTPGAEEALAEKSQIAYIGFDPTAPSLTIGNMVQIMMLKLWQLSGHTPVVLMGGATGRVGDPSGKDKERVLKSFDELDANLKFQQAQFYKFLNFEEGDNKATVINNLDFYKDMNVLDFLRDVGKTLTVNYMMSKDSVKNRLDSGLSFTEFSYQLLQAYDFQYLKKNHACGFQIGGSDQWGNITSGTEFIRRNLGEKAYAITSKLLTKSDGKKFGKSEAGNIWLDPKLTSPYKFYQFWIDADDADLPTFTRFFTLKSQAEIEAREHEFKDDPRMLKKMLAEELTKRVHSVEDYEAVLKVSELLFNKKASKEMLMSLDLSALGQISEEIPSPEISISLVQNGVSIADLLTDHTQILSSKGEARRAVQSNAISINKEKVSDFNQVVTAEALLQGKYIMIENGKKNKFLVQVNE